MLVEKATKVSEGDVSSFAWSGLRVFRNVEHTAAAILAAHNLGANDIKNVRKQANQIRHCLIQAEEYARAAETVTSATRPTLQYYSLVSLATAEILFKGTGDISLDKARDLHGHHGLSLTVQTTKGGLVGSDNLIARPPIFNGKRKGTFDLWHTLSRPSPLCGPVNEYLSIGQVVRHPMRALMAAPDVPPPPLPEDGYCLLKCFQHIPGLSRHLPNFGVRETWARCHIRRDHSEASGYTTFVQFHPADAHLLSAIYEKVHATVPESLTHSDFRSGRSYTFTRDANGDAEFIMPNGIPLGDDTYIWPYSDNEMSLNYFGWLYLASFILGTYARYYPDKWMQDIEQSNYIATAADAFYRITAAHAPLSTLSELSRVWFVPER